MATSTETWQDALERKKLEVQEVGQFAAIPGNRMYAISRRDRPAEYDEAQRIALTLDQTVEWVKQVLDVLPPGVPGRGHRGRRKGTVTATRESTQKAGAA